MLKTPNHSNGRLVLAVIAEASLVLLAWGLAWWWAVPMWRLAWPEGRVVQATLLGVAATLPMLGFLVWMLQSRWPPIAELRNEAEGLLGRLLAGATLGPIILLAIAAGVGEELLFRGAVQPGLAKLMPLWAAVAVAGLLFGMVHPISRMYVFVATIAGLYLGALAAWSGEVLSAIIAHGLYDVAALVVFLGRNRQGDELG